MKATLNRVRLGLHSCDTSVKFSVDHEDILAASICPSPSFGLADYLTRYPEANYLQYIIVVEAKQVLADLQLVECVDAIVAAMEVDTLPIAEVGETIKISVAIAHNGSPEKAGNSTWIQHVMLAVPMPAPLLSMAKELMYLQGKTLQAIEDLHSELASTPTSLPN